MDRQVLCARVMSDKLEVMLCGPRWFKEIWKRPSHSVQESLQGEPMPCRMVLVQVRLSRTGNSRLAFGCSKAAQACECLVLRNAQLGQVDLHPVPVGGGLGVGAGPDEARRGLLPGNVTPLARMCRVIEKRAWIERLVVLSSA